jgi:hypothetical protein
MILVSRLAEWKYLRATLATTAVFGVCGPPIGAATLVGALPLFIMITGMQGNSSDFLTRLQGAARMLPPALTGSYGPGIIPALFAGAVLSIKALYSGSLDYLSGLAVSLAAWLVFMAVEPGRDILEMALLIPVHVLPTMVCIWLAKRFWLKLA